MFADEHTIAEHTQIPVKAAKKAFRFIPQARAELRSVIGADTYDSVHSTGSGTDHDKCEQAESLLALSFALPLLNLRPTDRGGLSKAIGMAAENVEQLMSAREMERYAGIIRLQAIEIVADLVPEYDDEESLFTGAFGITATTNFSDEFGGK